MTDYSTCVGCGKPLMFTPITRQWVHITGNAGISHFATPLSKHAKAPGNTWVEVG